MRLRMMMLVIRRMNLWRLHVVPVISRRRCLRPRSVVVGVPGVVMLMRVVGGRGTVRIRGTTLNVLRLDSVGTSNRSRYFR